MSKAQASPPVSLSSMNRTHHTGGICEPDPIDPDRVPCHNPVLLDDRQGISHFFGRNKRATATIPVECYPLQCRTHYQERKYRMRDMHGAEAAYQCDSIMVTLERMSKLTWKDTTTNTVWPRWLGFELQTCKSGNTPDLEPPFIQSPSSGVIVIPDDVQSPKTPKKGTSKPPSTPGTGKKTPRIRKVNPPAPIPGWLAKLCSKKESGQDFTSIGDRGGARYTMDQLAKIVRAMKTWCIQNNARLPAVEALPITIGLMYEVQIADVKTQVAQLQRVHNLAINDLRNAHARRKNINAKQMALEDAEYNLEVMQENLKKAKEQLENAQDTLPVKRVHKKSPKKVMKVIEEIDDQSDAKMEDDL